MSKIGNIYVEIRGDYTKYKEDIQELKVTARVDGAKVSDALNNAITPSKASQAINQLNADLRQLSGAAKVPADNFKATADAISRDLGKIATSAGLTEKEFSALTEKMLQTQAQKATERSFNDIAKAAGLSHGELATLGKQLGFSTEQMGRLGISLGGANKDMGAQQTLLGSLQKNWVGFSLGINQAMEVIGKVYQFTKAVVDFGEAGANVERVERSFAAVASAAGLNGEAVVRAFKGAAQGLMDESDLMAKASRLIQENIPVEVIENLIRALAKQAPIVGETLPQAYEKFSDALITGNMKTVKLYTGTVELDDIYEKYAKSIGVTKEELSEEAKIKIRAIELTDLLTKKTEGLDGSYEGASEKIQRAKVALKDMKEQMEKEAIPVTLAFYNALTLALKAFNDLNNRPPPEWVLRQKYGSKGSGASGSWGPSANYTLDDATVNMRPLDLPLVVDPKKIKAEEKKLEEFRQMQIKAYTEEWDKLEKDYADYAKEQEKTTEFLVKYEIDRHNEGWEKLTEGYKEYNKNEIKEAEKTGEEIAKLLREEDDYRELSYQKRKVADEELWKLQKSISEDIAKMSNNDFQLRIDLVNQEYETRKKVVGESVQLELWKDLKLREILEEQALKYGSFWDGMAVQYQRNLRDQTTWGQEGAKIWNGVFGKGGALEGSLNTFFNDLFAGELKSAEDYFKSFTDSILKMFAKMIAEMIAQWAAANFANLIGLTGTGTGGGGSAGSSLTNTALNTAISKGGSAIYDYVFGAGTSAAGTAGAAALGSYAGEAGAMAGAMAEAGATGTAIGAGALASAGIAAWAAAPVIGSIWAYNKGKAEQIYGLNPFASEWGPANVAGNDTLSYQTPFINMLDWYKDALPSVEAFKERFKAEAGYDPPTGKLLRDQAGTYVNWMDRQPEIIAAQKAYIDYINHNYELVGDQGGESGAVQTWQRKDRHAKTPYSDSITYAAGGALIDEPMIAYGRSGKKIVMGEAGPEAIVPLGAGGQMVHLSLSLDSRVIGEAMYDLSKRGQKVVHQRGVTAN